MKLLMRTCLGFCMSFSKVNEPLVFVVVYDEVCGRGFAVTLDVEGDLCGFNRVVGSYVDQPSDSVFRHVSSPGR